MNDVFIKINCNSNEELKKINYETIKYLKKIKRYLYGDIDYEIVFFNKNNGKSKILVNKKP